MTPLMFMPVALTWGVWDRLSLPSGSAFISDEHLIGIWFLEMGDAYENMGKVLHGGSGHICCVTFMYFNRPCLGMYL
jgi:hypothetical protein